ncbi:TfoX/Sxy family protein [Paramicrobacterium agarici]|uniref:TfoX/Sxy family transcriptional regulator of competence genes n=1 Tax=Paramicrobacterium agarici TaxID=630514 RepID=A0A2A9DTT2_9MICO|nr:TfoX/Sxy family protein [Microbacterium agarici]PFG29781.1 TfoX/Sxy family transcriptional regulator of competence genes [Microbacterium agarici]
MSSDRRTAEFYRDQLAELGDIVISRMFGGWGLRLHGEFLGAVIDDVFYLKVEPVALDAMIAQGGHPFTYTRPSGKRVTIEKWCSVPDEYLDNAHTLTEFVRDMTGVL